MEHCQLMFFVMAVRVILTLRYSDTYITHTNIKEIIRIWPPLFANITANMFPVRTVLVRGEVHLTAHRIAHLHHGSRGRAVSTAVLAAARGREHHSWLLSWLLRDYSEYQRLMKPNSALQHAIDKYSCIELWITQISSYTTPKVSGHMIEQHVINLHLQSVQQQHMNTPSSSAWDLRRPANLQIRAMAVSWSAPKASLRERKCQESRLSHSITKLGSLQGNISESLPSIDDHIEATRLKFAKLNNEIASLENEDPGMYFFPRRFQVGARAAEQGRMLDRRIY